MIVVLVAGYVQLKRRCGALETVADEEVLKLFQLCRRDLRIKKKIVLKAGADSSLLIGILKPVICISDGFSLQELRYILIHELYHYKYKDTILNLILSAILCFFWYNPVMWMCFYMIRRDIERCCDQRVIEAVGERIGYAKVLVKATAGRGRFTMSSTSFIKGEKEVTGRIRQIAKFKKPGILAGAIAVIIIVFAAAVSLTGGIGATIKEMESVLYPGGYAQISVPSEWIKNMKEPTGNSYFYGGQRDREDFDGESAWFTEDELLFIGEDGAFAGLNSVPLNPKKEPLPDVDHRKETENFLRTNVVKHLSKITGKSAVEGAIVRFELMEIEAVSISQTTKFFDQKCSAVLEYGGEKYYLVFAFENHDVGFGEPFYSLWANAEHADAQELMDMMETVQPSNSGDDFKGNFSAISYGEKPEWEEDKAAAMEAMIKGRVASVVERLDMPVQTDLKDYKLHSVEEVKGKFLNEAIAGGNRDVGDQARWDVIYPGATLATVDYEPVPYRKENFAYGYGAGFEKTDSGSIRYRNRYAVFVENVYSDSDRLNDFYFLGFLSETEANADRDAAVLARLSDWYDEIVEPVISKENHTEYIGKAQDVARIVMSLPLKEMIDTSEGTFTDKTLILQTETEPYGLTINYWSEEPLPLYRFGARGDLPETNLVRPPFPECDVNFYVQSQIEKNAAQLFKGIENLSTLTINLMYKKELQEGDDPTNMGRSESGRRDENYEWFTFIYEDPYGLQ